MELENEPRTVKPLARPLSPSLAQVLRELEQEGYAATLRGWPTLLATRADELRLIKVTSPRAGLELWPEQVTTFQALARLGIVVEIARGTLRDCADFRDSLPPAEQGG